MATFTAKDVQALRRQTGAGMMDAKKALEGNNGDFVEAAKWLRETGIAKSATRSDRANTEGVVAANLSEGVAAAVELKCETDFVAKSEAFIAMAEDLADLVAQHGETAVEKRASELEDMKITLKENIQIGRIARFEAGPDEVLDGYVHMQNGRGVNVVLVHLSGGTAEVARDIAMHAAFSRPRWVKKEEVPDEVLSAGARVSCGYYPQRGQTRDSRRQDRRSSPWRVPQGPCFVRTEVGEGRKPNHRPTPGRQ